MINLKCLITFFFFCEINTFIQQGHIKMFSKLQEK